MLFWSTLTSRPLAAHDFWLEPSTYEVPADRRVSVSFREGHGEGHPLPRNMRRLERFEIHGPDGPMAVPGADRIHPAGVVPAPTAGLHLVGYLNNPGRNRLPAERFESYLAEEGLERISALRQELDQSDKLGTERYSRCAKTLFTVEGEGDGHETGDAWATRLGFPLELVPEANPMLVEPGTTLSVLLLFRGEPLAGAQVVAIARDAEQEPHILRSDERGRIRFPVTEGRWRVKSVHMERAPTEAGVDWESWWASLTFAVPAR